MKKVPWFKLFILSGFRFFPDKKTFSAVKTDVNRISDQENFPKTNTRPRRALISFWFEVK